jgi:protocatechuate 3,4-dioxygenase beta subunit
MSINSDRRGFLLRSAGAAGILAAASPVTRALAATCGLTPPQTPGPFYPGESRFGTDTDLTRVAGSSGRALGQVIYLRGRVVDAQCRPVSGANVEIWQACASGKYNSPKDPNPAKLDPNFKYWAETFTDERGEFAFKSVRPGAYPADAEWDRPPHIHFKVSRLGFRELVTQMYFAGDPLNSRDLILADLSPAERARVIVEFRPVGPELEPGALEGSFEITMRGVRG